MKGYGGEVNMNHYVNREIEYYTTSLLGKNFVFFPETISLLEIDNKLFELLKKGETYQNIVLPKEVLEIFEQYGRLNKTKSEETKLKQVTHFRGLTLDVTQECNMRCAYCYENSKEFDRLSRMDSETAKKAIIKLLKPDMDNQRRRLTFFGGEPLLNFDLIEMIVSYVEKMWPDRFSFGITTNATLIDTKIADFLTKKKFSVLVSLDGLERTQNILRPLKDSENSFIKTIHGIKLLNEKGLKPSIRCTSTSVNSDLSNFAEVFKELSIRKLYVAVVSTSNEHMIPESFELTSSYQKLYEYFRHKNGTFLGLVSSTAKKIESKEFSANCTAGRTMVTLASNGDVYICHRKVGVSSFFIGNVISNTFEEIVLTSKSKLNKLSSKIEECKNCWARNLCSGICMATIGLPEKHFRVYCEFVKKAIELSFVEVARKKSNSVPTTTGS